MSSTKDMASWMNIQMGVVQDISEAFKAVIQKSHNGNISVPDINGMYYAAGWLVNADKTIIVSLLAIIFFLLGLCRKNMNNQQEMPKKRIFSTVV